MLETLLRDGFDLDLGLRDASLDEAVAPTRRMSPARAVPVVTRHGCSRSGVQNTRTAAR